MSNKLGIVGFPNVGKSLLFNKLTKTNAARSANYLFCTIEPNEGVLIYQDDLLTKLGKDSKSKKVIYSDIELYDIAGLIKNAHEGQGLGNQFLSHIRMVDAILHVVRGFVDDDVAHAEGRVNPIEDYLSIRLELLQADLNHIQKKIDRTKSKEDLEKLNKIKSLLEDCVLSNNVPVISNVESLGIDLLSIKPEVVLLNGPDEEMIDYLKLNNVDFLCIDIPNIKQTEINEICEKVYKKLSLICFFTTGEAETRAWMIKEGTSASVASGVIHSDFPKKMIKVKTRFYDQSLVRTEGRDYIIKNREVVEFMIG